MVSVDHMYPRAVRANPCVRVPQQRTASRRAAVLGVVCVADSAARLLLPVQQARAVA